MGETYAPWRRGSTFDGSTRSRRSRASSWTARTRTGRSSVRERRGDHPEPGGRKGARVVASGEVCSASRIGGYDRRRRRRPARMRTPRAPAVAGVARSDRQLVTLQPPSADGADESVAPASAAGVPASTAAGVPASGAGGVPASDVDSVHTVSAPVARSPAGRVVPAPHATHSWFTTCSFCIADRRGAARVVAAGEIAGGPRAPGSARAGGRARAQPR